MFPYPDISPAPPRKGMGEKEERRGKVPALSLVILAVVLARNVGFVVVGDLFCCKVVV
jgi:hypothetical protein